MESSPSADPISVVICTRDRADLLPRTLGALREQTKADFELVIVDNAPSDDRTHRVVEREWPTARYVVEPVPGLPRARNRGVTVATGDVLVFTDDDCVPAPLWVESLARTFADHPAAGCVTGPIHPLELRTEAQRVMESRGGFNRGERRRIFLPDGDEGPVYPVQAWQFGAGGNMAFRRRALDHFGGFDEALSRSEDIDAFYWNLRAGYSLVFEPRAIVQHQHLADWPHLRRRMFYWGWGYLALLDKIVRTDTPEYRTRADLERRNWLRYQVRERLMPAIRGKGDVPPSLVVTEIAGGLLGYFGYPRRAPARLAIRNPPSP